MITGVVSAALEARISLRLQDRAGREQQVSAVIDTGFDGWLTLPPDLVGRLGLARLGRERGILADGSVTFFHLHEATLIWDGSPRTIAVAVAVGAPLVGMGLLEGFELTIQAVHGGRVRIEALAPVA